MSAVEKSTKKRRLDLSVRVSLCLAGETGSSYILGHEETRNTTLEVVFKNRQGSDSCASLSWYCPTNQGRKIKAFSSIYRLLVSGAMVESGSSLQISQESNFGDAHSDCSC